MKTIEVNNDLTLIYKPLPPLAVPAMLSNYERNHPRPKKPTYEFEGLGGVIVTKEHDETTVTKEEEKLAWSQYKRDIDEWQTELTQRQIVLLLLEGMEVKPSERLKQQWDSRLSRYYDLEGLDDDDYKLLYIQTFVLTSQAEIQKASEEIMGLTGVSQADLEAAEKLF